MRKTVTVAGGPSVTIQADPDQLEQLLINVFRNAVDATLDNRGGATVSWDLVDGRVRLRVDDEGPGLSNTTNLFVPFFTTKPGGSWDRTRAVQADCRGARRDAHARKPLPVPAAALN